METFQVNKLNRFPSNHDTIEVRLAGTDTLVEGLMSQGGTPLSNPFRVSDAGDSTNWGFYPSDHTKRYDIWWVEGGVFLANTVVFAKENLSSSDIGAIPATESYLAEATVSAHRILAVTPQGGVVPADPTSAVLVRRLVGLSLTAGLAGTAVLVRSKGIISEVGWSWNLNLPVFLGSNGQLTQNPPATGYSVVVGYPSSPTALMLNIQAPIQLSEE